MCKYSDLTYACGHRFIWAPLPCPNAPRHGPYRCPRPLRDISTPPSSSSPRSSQASTSSDTSTYSTEDTDYPEHPTSPDSRTASCSPRSSSSSSSFVDRPNTTTMHHPTSSSCHVCHSASLPLLLLSSPSSSTNLSHHPSNFTPPSHPSLTRHALLRRFHFTPTAAIAGPIADRAPAWELALARLEGRVPGVEERSDLLTEIEGMQEGWWGKGTAGEWLGVWRGRGAEMGAFGPDEREKGWVDLKFFGVVPLQ